MTNNNKSLIESIVAEIDTNTSIADLLGQSEPIKSQIDAWRATYEGQDLPDEVRWELFALDMMAVPRRNRQEAPDERFRPMFEFYNKDTDPPTANIHPDVTSLMNEEHAIAYYRHRAETTPNPIRKARYADFVWVALKRQGNRDGYRYGLEAADAYLAQAPLCIDQEDTLKAHIKLVEDLDRAAEIAIELNNRDLATRVVEVITNSLSKLPETASYRWVLDMGASLLYLNSKFHGLLPEDVWEGVKETCDKGISHYESERNRHLGRSLMELASHVSNCLGDDVSAWSYQVQIGASLERESSDLENEEGSKLAAYKFMEEAMHHYQRLVSVAPNDEEKGRLQEKVAETKREVRRLIREAESEMKLVSASVEIPRDILEQMIGPLLEVEPSKTFEFLSYLPFLLPDIDHIRKQALEAAEKYVFASLFGRVSLRNGRKVDEISGMEGESVQFLYHLDFWFQAYAQFLDFIFYRLREEGRFSTASFMAHLENWEFLDESDVPFIKVGLERYFADDFISALHVLTPRIEHMLKSAFEQVGLPPVAVPSQRQIREQTFGEFLRREEVRRVLGEAIWYYLSYALVDEKGWNLRNDIAHGWIASPNCNRTVVQIVLFAILLLTRLHRASESTDENSDTVEEQGGS